MLALTFLFVPGLVAAATLGARDTRQRAAYFLDNDPAGSSIVALKISVDDGTLSQPVRISTGGKGLLGLFGGAPGTAPAPGAAGKSSITKWLSVCRLTYCRHVVRPRRCGGGAGCMFSVA